MHFIFLLIMLAFVNGQNKDARLNITIRTDNRDEFEVGTPRVLACIVVGCAPSLNVIWYLGDLMLRPNVYKEVKRGNFTVSSLTFVPSLTDNGKELVCRATNGDLSQIFEDRVTISVGQRPACIDSKYKTIRAIEGESQTLTCVVRSDPDPEQFVWSFPDGRTIFTSSKKVLGHESRYSSVLVWVPQRDDYGPVYCRAVNRFGDQKQPCTFSVVNGVSDSADCDFQWESQEINDPCGKNVNNKRFPEPKPTKWDPFNEVHPEDAPPIEVYKTHAKFQYAFEIWGGFIVLCVVIGCLIVNKFFLRTWRTCSKCCKSKNGVVKAVDEVELREMQTNNRIQENGEPQRDMVPMNIYYMS